MAQDAFENLISGCPLLETLKLIEIEGFSQINIDSPSLKFLKIFGDVEVISFVNSFQLATVVVDLGSYLNSEGNQGRLHGSSSNLLKFFDLTYKA